MSGCKRGLVGLLAVMALLFAAAPADATQTAAGQERVDVIVVLDSSGADARSTARAVARDHDGRIRHIYEHSLEGFSANIPAARRQGLEADRRVAYVNDDLPVDALEQTVPTGVARIDAPAAHSTATGEGVRVAVIDTGIDSDHEDLTANLDLGNDKDCINDDSDAEDDQGHGTHVAGTIAAVDNGVGVVGVAPAATLVGIKVLDHKGSGSWASVICGIDHVAALNNDDNHVNDIHVANMSLGGSGSLNGTCGNTTDSLYAAICAAVGSGATFTVAAGNDSKDASGFVPAAYPEVITVSAYQDTDGTSGDAGCSGKFPFTVCDEEFASFSNYGDIVDVIAPGRNIRSTTYDGTYGSKSGTSMAAPHVAGVAALLLQSQPSLTPSQVEAHLRDTGQCPDAELNAGTGDCSGQGTWKNDPDSWVEPMANAAFVLGSTDGGSDEDSGDTTAPAAPTNLTATPGDGTVSLDWGDNTESDLATYNVYRSTTAGSYGTALATGVTSSTYTDTVVTNGTTYHYVVTAVDTSSNESPDSNEVSATPQSSTNGGDGTDLVVAQETYTQSGGKTSDKHLDVTISITDGTAGVDGVTVSIDLYNGATFVQSSTATTSGGGYVTFSHRNVGPGCYWADVQAVQKPGHHWDGNELANECG